MCLARNDVFSSRVGPLLLRSFPPFISQSQKQKEVGGQPVQPLSSNTEEKSPNIPVVCTELLCPRADQAGRGLTS